MTSCLHVLATMPRVIIDSTKLNPSCIKILRSSKKNIANTFTCFTRSISLLPGGDRLSSPQLTDSDMEYTGTLNAFCSTQFYQFQLQEGEKCFWEGKEEGNEILLNLSEAFRIFVAAAEKALPEKFCIRSPFLQSFGMRMKLVLPVFVISYKLHVSPMPCSVCT